MVFIPDNFVILVFTTFYFCLRKNLIIINIGSPVTNAPVNYSTGAE